MTAIRTALIVGGGEAGCGTALALQKAGPGVEIHEARATSDAGVGAFPTLAGNGMCALRQIGSTRWSRRLRDHPDTATAFARYEQLRRDRVEANVAAGAGVSGPRRTTTQPAAHRTPTISSTGTQRAGLGACEMGVASQLTPVWTRNSRRSTRPLDESG